jgi:hypothetical protein
LPLSQDSNLLSWSENIPDMLYNSTHKNPHTWSITNNSFCFLLTQRVFITLNSNPSGIYFKVLCEVAISLSFLHTRFPNTFFWLNPCLTYCLGVFLVMEWVSYARNWLQRVHSSPITYMSIPVWILYCFITVIYEQSHLTECPFLYKFS